ncbi:MAG: hypothetical protein U1D30_00165 [Planctomycetota bacterium]
MPAGNRIYRNFTGVMAAFVALALQPAAIGQDTTGRLLDQMRARRLDGLLEEFCARNLRRDNLAEFDRARFASSLAGLLTDRAMEAKDEKQRDAAWDGALRALTEALNDTQSATGKISLGYQIAVLELVRGEWWRQHGELHPEQNETRSRAKRQLASAIARLKELDLTLFPIIQRGKQMKRPTPASRQALELEPLANAITYRLGLAELTLARCLDEDDPNRKELLRSAIGHIEPTARSSNHAAAFQASIDSQLAARLMGDFPAANAILDRWMNEKPSPDEADLLVAERVDWLLDQHKSKDALDLLETTLKSRSSPPPRWSYLYIKALLQSASEEKDARRVTELHAHAFRQLRVLESMGDTPWLLRGETLLREQASNLSSEDSANVRRAAEILAKSGEYAQAADLFRDAAAKAEKSARTDEVVALLAESGRVLESAGKHADAAAIFIDLAARQPDHPRAPAHLLRRSKNLCAATPKGAETGIARRLNGFSPTTDKGIPMTRALPKPGICSPRPDSPNGAMRRPSNSTRASLGAIDFGPTRNSARVDVTRPGSPPCRKNWEPRRDSTRIDRRLHFMSHFSGPATRKPNRQETPRIR